MNTPILFLVFNRPDTTKQVFQKIKEARPPRLYVAADGPREGREYEAKKCAQVRQIATEVDWECEVNTLFRKENLGCKMAVSGGIDWFFENEEMGIILEDDCLPSITFFRFCEDMLTFFEDDKRVMQITGTNKLNEWKSDLQDFHYSIYGSCWGWATWKDAWQLNDLNMKDLHSEKVKTALKNSMVVGKHFKKRYKILKSVKAGAIDSWAYTWFYTRALNSGLSVVPSINLISNVGFGNESTHTKNPNSVEASLPIHNLKIKRLNQFVVPDREYDFKIMENTPLLKRIINKIKYIIKNEY